MKKQTFTQAMAWLHTWGGLLFGWPLFAIFLTGSLAVFDQEIDHWMQPEIQRQDVPIAQAAAHGLAYLQRHHADAGAWSIALPSERMPGLAVTAGDRRNGITTHLDPRSGEPLKVREAAGGSFFFHFHYTLNLPRQVGIWVVGLVALATLAALVSGIVIHKKLFKEFFTFRPNKGQRSWLDAHNAAGVLLMPFHLMIVYTGLIIFGLIYLPAALQALYDGDFEAFYQEHIEEPPHHHGPSRAPAAQLVALGPLLEQAEQRMGPLAAVSISHPGQADALVEVRRVLGNRIALSKGHNMVFDGVSGELLAGPPELRPSVLTQRVMFGLHFAQFGGYPMRWLYFFCGLVGSAMIASGLVLFTVKRRRKYLQEGRAQGFGNRLIESLNIAVIAGLALACIGLFWINRLLPVELAQRAGWELRLFFAIWALSLLHGWCRPHLQAWREQLGLAALLCLGLPLLSALTLEWPWVDQGRLLLELAVLACGALLAWTALRVGRKGEQPAPRRAARTTLEVN
ncbi:MULTISPECIES: PepSY-associated TM helix domain-containing protein [unclassified Pseudomonas]|uniref:PepSY-associated TM helix domain-containing protein n=1 Tax=unclassified Pseudomonas TaxID=196821 RepID=UPI0024495E4C|nr:MULTISPECIES: PepSY-associated TM helix domain-containing protein [unclassified Pseudomonas]MDG9924983.1 PepSY domain-containing protein [Pseudomonas sp. GD04045]MDH0036264.1 PepSY domain-containing protein [Pseudomonas sp. GD04019]